MLYCTSVCTVSTFTTLLLIESAIGAVRLDIFGLDICALWQSLGCGSLCAVALCGILWPHLGWLETVQEGPQQPSMIGPGPGHNIYNLQAKNAEPARAQFL